jgi:hypothetical protein
MDVKNQQLFMNLYVGIAYLKWLYGSYNRKDASVACLVSWQCQ